MKKTKILTVLGVLLAMGITACGGKTASKSGSKAADGSSAGGQSTSQPAPSSSKPKTHQHVWDEGRVTTQPTCEEEGEKTFTCTGEGTCPQNNTKTEKIPANGHTWGEAQPVAAANGGVSYNKYVCSVANCGAVKYDIDLTGENRIKLVDGGTLKTDNNVPGFIKLNSPNGGGFEIQFNSDEYGVGKIYQNGVMDHFSGSDTANQSKGFFSGNNTSTTHADENGNFILQMNGVAVDISDKKSSTYVDMFPKLASDNSNAYVSGYSPLGEVETGAVTVGKGLNTIKFTRVDSFNIILKSFVIVFKPAAHEHTLSDTGWVETKAPTCLPGVESQQCSVCKATITRALPATDPHTYGEWEEVTPATCAQGLQKRVCNVCGFEEFQPIAPITSEHTFPETPVTVEATGTKGQDDYRVGYDKYVCSVCGTWKVIMKADQGTLAEGSELKPDDNIAGGYKLNGNNQSFSYAFNFDTRADVTVYQRGCMDNWNSNKDVTYYHGKKNNSKAKLDTPNFEFDVNGVAIDLSELKDVRADSVLTDRADDDPLKNSYSAIGDILIGEAELVEGKNTFVYKRLNSYNYIITDIVLIVTPRDHAHEASENWVNTDETYHWQNCKHNDGKKMNKAPHEFGDWSIVTPATETEAGEMERLCTVCGRKETKPLAAGTTLNSDKKVVKFHYTEEHAIDYEAIAVEDGTVVSGNIADGTKGKMTNGTVVKWKMPVTAQGEVTISISIKMSNASHSSQTFDPTAYAIKVGGVAQSLLPESQTYENLGLSTNVAYIDLAKYTVTEADVTAGEIEIEFDHNNSSYRLLFDEDLRVAF